MGKMYRIWTWLRLLNKRLLRKPVFVVLLLLIPALVFGYSAATKEESGMMTVALAREGEDILSRQVMEELIGSSQLILFRECATTQEAEEQVIHGKADAAWIFPDELARRVEEFAADSEENSGFIRVIQREDNVALMLTREILGGKIYELCAEKVYLGYIRENLAEWNEIPESKLLELFRSTDLSGELFTYEQTDGSSAPQVHQADYLTSPVRGLLAVVIVLCGLAVGMFYVQDCSNGTFSWMSERKRPMAELSCQMVALTDLSLVVWGSLALAGLAGPAGRELLALLLYGVCVACFSMMMRRLCGSIRVLGLVMPVLAVVMLVVCPVFFDLGALRGLQLLFPPTYYIQGIYNGKYLLYMVLYALVCCLMSLAAEKVLKRD